MLVQKIKFEAKLWRYQGKAAWYFITLPEKSADQVRYYSPHRGGFGSVPVEVCVGASEWKTSVFPDKKSNSFLLPVKALIRKMEGLSEGSNLSVTLLVRP